MPNSIAVIVSTYNRPDALDAVLRGLSKQSDRAFEVIVADDGSGPETADVVAGWQARIGQPLRHVWHPDEGFRLAEIRNRAIGATEAAYIIFLDGDCVPRRGFIADHRRLSEPGWFVTGSRILLSKELTEEVLAKDRRFEESSIAAWLGERLRGRVGRILPLFGLPGQSWRKRAPQRIKEVRGCNMAFWRSDLVRVGGFDAAFKGWGSEDWDLAIRLIRTGVQRKSGRCAAAVFHLWHQAADRSGEEDNLRRLRELEASERTIAVSGLSAG